MPDNCNKADSKFNRLAKKLEHSSTEIIIATTRENFFWLTNCDPVGKTLNPHRAGWFALFSGRTRKTAVAMPLSESDQILDMSPKPDHFAFHGTFFRERGPATDFTSDEIELLGFHEIQKNHTNWHEALLQIIEQYTLLPGAKIAIDEDGLNSTSFAIIKTALDNAGYDVTNGTNLLQQCRSVKTIEEIEILRAGSTIGLSTYGQVARNAKEGITELELRMHFEAELLAKGALPRLSMLRIGRNAVFGQRQQRNDILWSRDELLWFDCDFSYHGYWIDVARSFIPRNHHRSHSIYRALAEAQAKAIQMIRPGMVGADVFAFTLQNVWNNGFANYRRQHVGHGIGLEPYERPILSPSSSDCIEVGNVICVETPYYEFGLGALHVEDLVLIGEKENVALRPDALAPLAMAEIFKCQT